MKQELESYFDRLWPICRSLTGNGNRETLKILSEIVDLNISEIPSGTACFDWVVPPEWNAKEAWIKDSHGNIIVDFKNNNLHLLGYSVPFKGRMSLSELKSHLYTLPEQPDLIPYQTSYYKECWGFCITHNQLLSLEDGEYEVYIDSSLNPKGSMTIADALIKGETEEEVLLSTYICHPSMASNELSGPLISSFLYQLLKTKKLRYTYRFIFVPETRYGKYKEYHTSADNKDFISFDAMQQSINTYFDILNLIEANHKYINKIQFCEPQLGKRGLYPTLISQKENADFVSVMMWLLNLADGTNDLIDIANRSKAPYKLLIDIAQQLVCKNLLAIN